MSGAEPAVSFVTIPEISAIYYGLLQRGYDYYAIERSPEHIRALEQFLRPGESPAFFSGARQDTCQVYPYWPRAALLETAVFYLERHPARFRDWEGFRRRVLSAGNLSPRERGPSLWEWIAGFPAALDSVLADEGFQRYLTWERQWLADRTRTWEPELAALRQFLKICQTRYNAPSQRVQLVVQPIKCPYSADYFRADDSFTYISGGFRAGAVAHELLHPILHPLVEEGYGRLVPRPAPFPGVDPSYYLAGDDAGWQNAFEEYAVRTLTGLVLQERYPEKLSDFLAGLLEQPS